MPARYGEETTVNALHQLTDKVHQHRAARIYSFDDARRMAKRQLPKLVFDYYEGGAGSELALARNRKALDNLLLSPRALVNVDKRDLSTRFLDKDYPLPFGIAPMGMCNLAHPGTDLALAAQSKQRAMPMGLSTAASTSIEDAAAVAGENLWFQLYVGQSIELGLELVERAKTSGCQVLILTVDVPVVAERLRDRRNGFKAPMKIGPRQFIDFALHPHWSLSTLKAGAPELANFVAPNTEGNSSGDSKIQQFSREEGRGKLTWEFLKTLRDTWKGKLIIKGILHPDDAKRAVELGVDAVYVSNHGGRQLDSAPAAITQLRRIREALDADFPLLFDSGVRSGDDLVRALACGANLVMIGRPLLFAAASAGSAGIERMIDVLDQQTSSVMAQTGVTSINEISGELLVKGRERTL